MKNLDESLSYLCRFMLQKSFACVSAKDSRQSRNPSWVIPFNNKSWCVNFPRIYEMCYDGSSIRLIGIFEQYVITHHHAVLNVKRKNIRYQARA